MTSPTDISETTVRKSITVNAPIARAFDVFTTRFDTWWPRSHHIGAAEMAEAILDARVGGSARYHATHVVSHADEVAWLDCYIIRDGKHCPGNITNPRDRVQIHFETTGSYDHPKFNPPYVSSDFPLPETRWQREFLHANGSLSVDGPPKDAAGRTYETTPLGRQAYVSGAGVADTFGNQSGEAVDSLFSQGYGPADS